MERVTRWQQRMQQAVRAVVQRAGQVPLVNLILFYFNLLLVLCLFSLPHGLRILVMILATLELLCLHYFGFFG